MKSIVFLISHPIQYYAPLYRDITKENFTSVEVVYCSDEYIKGKEDKEFGVNIKWDIPLLEGYSYTFIKNSSLKPSTQKGFWGLVNWGIITYLFKKPKSVLVIHGWGYFTNILAVVAGKLSGHLICLRGETPWHQEKMKKGLMQACKKAWLKVLFSFVDQFLYIGHQNRLFYRQNGVPDKKLTFTPYAVDNARFTSIAASVSKTDARNELGLPLSKKVVLFSGKYIVKKRPMELLQAFKDLDNKDYMLVMVGEGELRNEMEKFIEMNDLSSSVLLTGFINQSSIPLYYAAADVFVMCSGIGETWGLSVNEAMNFGLPVIVSETTGCSYDLVKNGINGFVFETEDITALTQCLNRILSDDQLSAAMAKKSKEIISDYSFEKIIEPLKTLCRD
jgi:glycosyltransferase involved in cell wall biosynthesis